MLNAMRWFVLLVQRLMLYSTWPVARMSQQCIWSSCRAPVYRKLPSGEKETCGGKGKQACGSSGSVRSSTAITVERQS